MSPAKTKVYLVDDHALIRRGLTTLIESEPDMVVCGEAADAPTALREVSRLVPDVVIVDISLRDSSGLELIKDIRAMNPSVQMLALSMHDESVYALRALKAGARGYVMKQDVVTKVVDGLRRVRGGQLFVSDEIANQMLSRIAGGDSPGDGIGIACLSDRELEIVTLIGRGLLTREIAAQLHVSIKTIETHRAHIKEKLSLRNATHLVQFCVRWVEENHGGGASTDSRAVALQSAVRS
jgi:DNA-binding NarL/FixJ family response regulator